MRRIAWCCCVVVVAACSKSDTAADSAAAADSPAAATPAMAAPAAPAAINLADVAGTWSLRSVPESGSDTTPTLSELTAAADTTGWSIKFANGQTVPMRVSTSGDSVVWQAGPYSSARRQGVQVVTDGVMRLQGGQLVGTTVAHYRVSGPDSVLRLRTQGTRKP